MHALAYLNGTQVNALPYCEVKAFTYNRTQGGSLSPITSRIAYHRAWDAICEAAENYTVVNIYNLAPFAYAPECSVVLKIGLYLNHQDVGYTEKRSVALQVYSQPFNESQMIARTFRDFVLDYQNATLAGLPAHSAGVSMREFSSGGSYDADQGFTMNSPLVLRHAKPTVRYIGPFEFDMKVQSASVAQIYIRFDGTASFKTYYSDSSNQTLRSWEHLFCTINE